ncbi:MAG: hypothetical protein FJ271_25485 [Planctomycetes bacterium]|nr:hypothetical protein [Planctomycetota bacterium]
MTRSKSIRLGFEVLEDRCTPAIYTVTNLADAGAGSLRQAVLNANAHAGADTIVFKDGLEGTIKLAGPGIAISDALLLDGPGASKITVQGLGHIFDIMAPATTKVKIDGLCLIRASDSAIHNRSSLTLTGMIFSQNEGSFGAAVVTDGDLTVLQSRFVGNRVSLGGGAIFVSGGHTLVDQCSFVGNSAYSDTSGDGGAIYVNRGSMTLRRSTVTGNRAREDGGGVFFNELANYISVEKSVIENNQAVTGEGGGIHAAAVTVTITDSKIRYNISYGDGGGIRSKGRTDIRRSSISGNVSTNEDGGGISQSTNSLVLLDSSVSGNRADESGGGIFLVGTTQDCTVRGSAISGNWAARTGGGLNAIDTIRPVYIQNSTISGNSAEGEGGGADFWNSVALVQNCTIAFNRANDGGGIRTNSDVSLDSSIVAHNQAALGTEDLHDPYAGAQLPFLLRSCVISTAATDGVNDGGGNQFNVDPRLAPLANNGGLTATHALRRGSPTINRGFSPTAFTTDQRGPGFARKVGAAVDVGAFERVESPLPAATTGNFVVSNLNDAGKGSLRQAIINANNHPGFDTIVFKPGLEGTIKLTSGQMQIASAMFIDGPGAGKFTVDGNQLGRIFVVSGPTTMNVTIDGLTLFNGGEEFGGAIANTANLKLVGMVLMGNSAVSGGAVFNNAGHLTIQKSRLFLNTASAGGGAVAGIGTGSVRIEDTAISNNKAANGGGVFASDGRLTLLRTSLTASLADVDGGGVYAAEEVDSVSIQKSTIDGNYASIYGGGVRTEGGPTYVTDSKIVNNRSENTGGGLAANGHTDVRRSIISGNISYSGPGGGIAQYLGDLTLLQATVRDNRALNNAGGGVFIDYTSSESRIIASTISGNWGQNGGGLMAGLHSSTLLIRNSTISMNVASIDGGGAYLGSKQTKLIQNSTIAFNVARFVGGISTEGPTTLESTIVAYNVGDPFASINPTTYLALRWCLISTAREQGWTDAGGNQFNADPRLAPLANNGGLTATHALKKGSAAINRGSNPTNLPTDQRGGKFLRKLGPRVDIGAFERE